VFDWDGHTDEVRRAKQDAGRAGVKVALSNPSFEVWLLWHFIDFMKYGCSQHDVAAALNKVWASYTKGPTTDFSKLPDNSDAAGTGIKYARQRSENARRYFCSHEESFRYPDDRPSTDVDRLLVSIIQAWHAAHEPGAQCPLLLE